MRVLTVTHAVRTVPEREVAELLLQRLRRRGVAVSSLVWDRGMVDAGLDLEAHGPVREIESLNRWRLPQVLGHLRLRPVARLLRNRRVRGWWRGIGPPDAVILLGPLRPEMRHYLPPGEHPTGLLLAERDLEPAESLPLSLELAELVVGPTASAVDGIRGSRTFADLLPDAPEDRPAPGPGAGRVVGIGPADWRGAPELFLRAAAVLQARRPGLDLTWIGVDPDDGRSYPYRFDGERLGLADRLTWTVDPRLAVDRLAGSDVVVLTARAPFALPVHPWTAVLDPAAVLEALDTPVVAFDTPAGTVMAGGGAVLAPYPDVDALADAVDAALDRTRPSRLDEVLDELLVGLGVGRP